MNYYNEHDAHAAEWLRELIKAGQIPVGDVDQRDIQTVKADELTAYTQCHFFAGIGGWSLALRLAGWPDNEPVWTGSCPCQPFSVAGQGMGEADDRHLWPDFRNLIGKRQPPVVFGEQVASADGRKWLAGVSANLEALAYRFAAADLCAAGVRAPHRRQRLFWVADSQCSERRSPTEGRNVINGRNAGREETPSGNGADSQAGGVVLTDGSGWNSWEPAAAPAGYGNPVKPTGGIGGLVLASKPGLEGLTGNGNDRNEPGRLYAQSHRYASTTSRTGAWDGFDVLPFRDGKARRVEAGTFPLAHGIPGRVGLLRGYGNAIVPQVAAQFIEAWCASVFR